MYGYKRRLNAMLDEIYAESDRLDMSLDDLAKATGLCYETVRRLNARITELPRLKTVMLLAFAVGMDVELVARAMRRRRAG